MKKNTTRVDQGNQEFEKHLATLKDEVPEKQILYAEQGQADKDSPMNNVEVIDQTLLDLIIADEKTGKVLGRAWLTVDIDLKSRSILNIFFGKPPNSDI